MRKPARWTALLVAGVVAVVAVQAVATWYTSQRVQAIVEEIRQLEDTTLQAAKTRGEIAQIRIRNELDRFFWQSLLTSLLPLASAAVAVVGAWVGLRRYLDTREKERLDRAANDLSRALEHLASDDARKRTMGVVGLQHFFTPDKREYHLRALAALAALARMEADEEVQRALRVAMEQAAAVVEPALLREVSWRGAKLQGVDLEGRVLAGLDLRDAGLEDANLSEARLEGARLDNARLNGADLSRAHLEGADLTYADLAGADLSNAHLGGAVLREAKVLRVDLNGADLTDAVVDPEQFRWDLADNWRTATLEPDLRERLIERYGPAGEGTSVLMLLWEMPPMVAGGTWTAAYHLVRNLKRRGVRLTVAVPWSEWALSPLSFDTDVPVVSMGIDPPTAPSWAEPGTASPYGAPSWSPYGAGPAWSPYGSLGGAAADPSGRTGPYGAPVAGPYGLSSYAPAAGGLADRSGSALMRFMEVYRRRIARFVRRGPFEVIHAHDWVTFPAAMEAAERAGIPWVAHFHSTEVERNPDRPQAPVRKLEAEAAGAADALVTPSRGTAARLADQYGVATETVRIVPNCLSRDEVRSTDLGSFETRRVVFLGRLARQKGPDLFAGIAAAVTRRRPDVTFVAHGEGTPPPELGASPVRVLGALDWSARGRGFRGATAAIVPSRAEPFGMVILEAMQHRVPVLYPDFAGAAEVLGRDAGVRIDPEDPEGTADRLLPILDDWQAWEETVEAQAREIEDYPARGYERKLTDIWARLAPDDGASAGEPLSRPPPS